MIKLKKWVNIDIFMYMKFRFLFCFLFVTSILSAQKYATRSGKTSFIGSEETFEQIKAVNSVSTAIVDSSSGDIAILLFIGAFDFEISLMQEHFNENYMDSSKYPKATFSGNIQNFSFEELLDSEKDYKILGVLTIRGIEKNVSVSCRLKKISKGLSLKTNFNVSASDFDIKIPKVVRNKISQEINIIAEYDLFEKL
ncbi:YceI family protein [Flavobacteriaceae bacterium]|nr:YceI family protein [Flavobacteriaceae bacterium]